MARRLFTIRTQSALDGLRSGLFLLPCIMSLAAVGLAILMAQVDQTAAVHQLAAAGWIYSGSPQGATVLLSTVAARVRRPDDLAVLRRQALMLERGARDTVSGEWDRARITARFGKVMASLDSTRAAAVHATPTRA